MSARSPHSRRVQRVQHISTHYVICVFLCVRVFVLERVRESVCTVRNCTTDRAALRSASVKLIVWNCIRNGLDGLNANQRTTLDGFRGVSIAVRCCAPSVVNIILSKLYLITSLSAFAASRNLIANTELSSEFELHSFTFTSSECIFCFKSPLSAFRSMRWQLKPSRHERRFHRL